MHYYSLNKKLFSTIAVIVILFVFCNLWLNHSETFSSTANRDSNIISVFLDTLAAIGIALIVTAIGRTVAFVKGNRHQARYPVAVIAIIMILTGMLLSFATYTTPLTVEISAASCSHGSSISIGIPECYGQITNPGLWPAVGVTIAGLALLTTPNVARQIKRYSVGH